MLQTVTITAHHLAEMTLMCCHLAESHIECVFRIRTTPPTSSRVLGDLGKFYGLYRLASNP